MLRNARVVTAGLLHHIAQRGNGTPWLGRYCVVEAITALVFLGKDFHRGLRERVAAMALRPSFAEVTVRQQSGVPGDLRSTELQLDLAVEIDPERLLVCFTDWILRILTPKPGRSSCLEGSNQFASYHGSHLIWEIRPESDNAGPTSEPALSSVCGRTRDRYVSFDLPRRSSRSCLACRCRQNSIT